MCVFVVTTDCGCGSLSCLRELRTVVHSVPTRPSRLYSRIKAATRLGQQVRLLPSPVIPPVSEHTAGFNLSYWMSPKSACKTGSFTYVNFRFFVSFG